MGWKGVVREIGRVSRAMERESKRRERELEKQEKEYDKMLAREQAEYEIKVYENHIDVIQSLHKECSNYIDWHKVAKTPKPITPQHQDHHESLATYKHDNFKAGFFNTQALAVYSLFTLTLKLINNFTNRTTQ